MWERGRRNICRTDDRLAVVVPSTFAVVVPMPSSLSPISRLFFILFLNLIYLTIFKCKRNQERNQEIPNFFTNIISTTKNKKVKGKRKKKEKKKKKPAFSPSYHVISEPLILRRGLQLNRQQPPHNLHTPRFPCVHRCRCRCQRSRTCVGLACWLISNPPW